MQFFREPHIILVESILNTTEETSLPTLILNISTPVSIFHTFIVLSQDPDTIFKPSLLNANVCIKLV